MKDIDLINKTINKYFEDNPELHVVPAKDLMPQFIKAGIFEKDTKMGLPIRRLLRALTRSNELHLIPNILAEQKEENTHWSFSREPAANLPAAVKPVTRKVSAKSKKQSDEHYVLDLCDEVLKVKGARQHRFDFLLGDEGKDGQRIKLPVDIYYAEKKLVVEYKEQLHSPDNVFFDKPDIITITGISRGEQRKKYDQLRMDLLPVHGITLVELFYTLFHCDSKNRIIRNREEDIKIVKAKLSSYL